MPARSPLRRPHEDDPPEVDDAIEDLTPLDGDHDDDHPDEHDPGDEIDWTPDASSDDAAAGDLPIGEHDVFEDPPESMRDRPSLGPPSAKPPSIDHDDESPFDDAERASDTHPPDGSSLGIDLADEIEDDDASDADDGGVEGTDEDIAAEVDESALPELDADGGAAFEVDDLMRELAERGFGRESNEPAWVLREGLQRDGVLADVVVDAGRVVAVGAEIVELASGDGALRSARLPAAGSKALVHRAGVVVAAGEKLLTLGARASGNEPLVLFEAHRPIRSVALFAGRVWAVAGDALWVIASPPSSPQRVRERGARSVAASEDALFLLSAEEGALRLSRFRGDDGDWEVLESWRLDPDPTVRDGLVVSRGGSTLAFADRDTLWHAWDRGASWSSVEIEGLVAFTPRTSDGADELILLVRQGGKASLATLGPTGTRPVEIPCDEPSLDAAIASGGAIAMAWCDVRESLFVASARGLVVVGPRRTH